MSTFSKLTKLALIIIKPVVVLSNMCFICCNKFDFICQIEKNKSWILDNPYSIDGISNWRKKSEVWEEISKNFNILTEV